MGMEFGFNEKVMEIDGGDGCKTMRVYLMPLDCTLKMAKVLNFMYFTTTF